MLALWQLNFVLFLLLLIQYIYTIKIIHPPHLTSLHIPFAHASFGRPYITNQCIRANLFSLIEPTVYSAKSALSTDDSLQYGCNPLQQLSADIENKIVIVKRGMCTFVNKAKQIQDAGGAGMIVINNSNEKLHIMTDGLFLCYMFHFIFIF